MSDGSEDDDNAFEFILLKEHQPSQAPVANELITLSNSGLGKVIIEIHVTNTVSDVYNSIKKYNFNNFQVTNYEINFLLLSTELIQF